MPCMLRVYKGNRRRYIGQLGEPICRRPVMPVSPSPAAPLCAPRPDYPVVCPGFGLDRFFEDERFFIFRFRTTNDLSHF